ncbi:MAG: cysteine desulfurase [Rhizobiaceae bacterium]|nr:cysteine desulfurase [Rhizobiaceae bacterium]
MAQRVYLDFNASAPLISDARAAMLALLDLPGNASSVHREGNAQKRAIADARRAVAGLVKGKPGNVVFTSGATEAAAMLLTPEWTVGRAPIAFDTLLAGATEHPCIAAGGRFQGHGLAVVPVDHRGLIRQDALDALLAQGAATGRRPLVAIQIANNETGVIQDIAPIAGRVHAAGGFLIADASQAAGRIPLDVEALGADALILSAHKMGGPKGAGAIVFAGEIMRPRPLLNGGGQEQGFRAGTENAPAIAGFGAAARAALDTVQHRNSIRALRDSFEQALLNAMPGVTIHGADAARLDNTSFFSIVGRKAETLMIGLDLAGIAVSSGSACSSGKVGRSAVLEAMGWAAAEGAIRVSFGPHNTHSDVDRLLAALTTPGARAGNG